jgi:hypothetical protein
VNEVSISNGKKVPSVKTIEMSLETALGKKLCGKYPTKMEQIPQSPIV